MNIFLPFFLCNLLVIYCNANLEECEITCNREGSIKNAGFSYNINLVDIDVGKCVQGDTAVTGSGEKGFMEEEEEEEEEDRSSCTCVPHAYSHLTIYNRSGPSVVPTIKSCSAVNERDICTRISEYHHFYENTSYATRVDLGRCVGRCGGKDTCLPTQEVSLAVKGPNGDTTVKNISECGCGNHNCYRQDYFQAYQMLEAATNETHHEVKEKIVNVGKCSGECKGIVIPGRCFPSKKFCLFQIGAVSASCVPIETKSESYLSMEGIEKDIAVLSVCGCARA